MDERRALDKTAYGSMFFFCVVMGLQSISVKVIAQDVAPIMQIALRSGLAAILVIVYMFWMGENFAQLKKFLLPGSLAGLFFALEYVFVAEALRFTTAARMTVFLYTAPLFSALILHFCKKSERLSPWQWVGVMITFCGIIAAFWEISPKDNAASYPHMLFGDILALIGSVLWALTIITLRLSRLQSAPGAVSLFYQLVLTAVILFVVSTILRQSSFILTGFIVLNLTYQTLFVAFGCTLLWLWLIRIYAATRIGILSFLTPLFTLVFAIILLNEPVGLPFVIGTILVVSGLIVSARKKPKRLFT